MDVLKNKLFLILFLFCFTIPVIAQTYLINETFGTVPPSGWTNYGMTQGTTAQDGDASSLLIDGTDSIITIAANDPDRVSFWYAENSNATKGSITVQYREGATGSWNDITTITPNSTNYSQYNSELNVSGDVYFKIISGVTRKEILVDVFQVTQSIVVSDTSLTGFVTEPETVSAEQSFTVSGADLTADITLTPPTHYEISESSGSGFGSSITLTQSGGTVNTTTIYVRLKTGQAEGTYNGETITIASTGKISKTLACSGDVRQSINQDTTVISNFSYLLNDGPSSEQSFNVSGQDLTADITLTPPTNFEISSTSGSGFGSTVTLTQTAGIVDTTTIYVRLKAGLSEGSYNNEDITISSTGKTSRTVTLNGFVGPMILNIKVFIEGAL